LKHQFDRALVEFEQAGGKVRAHFNVAQLYFQEGMVGEARDHYHNALGLNPSHEGSQKGLEICSSLTPIREEAQQVAQAAPASATAPGRHATVGKEKTTTDVKDARLEISNGNGVRKMAQNMGRYLGNKGFQVVRLTNAEHFSHANAGIYYREDYLDAALLVAKEIPGVQRLRPMPESNRPDIHIKVLLGKDIVSHKRVFEDRS